MARRPVITRFAPSPTGPLHLGHAYSAMLGHDRAKAEGGTFLLRIDDLDSTRSRPEWETLLKQDLAWLGLDWPEPCRKQSDCISEYEAALDELWGLGVLYPCTCTRRDIVEAQSAPQEGVPTHGPDGLIYPGTCRQAMWQDERWFDGHNPRPKDVTLRLNMAEACDVIRWDHRITAKGGLHFIAFEETGAGPNGEAGEILITPEDLITRIGDVALSRKAFGAAYHLAVVVDDAAQNVSHVIRGQDLFEATKIHVFLQRLLGLPTPVYHHHKLIRDENGKRLAKRDDARAIAKYRDEGATPEDIRRMVGLT